MDGPFAPGLLTRLPAPPRKVVVVRASRLGDFLCASPAFRALRAALPGAEITLVGLPFVRDLVDRSPHLDRLEEFPGFPGMADQFFDARRTTCFLERMQAEEFDLAIQLHGSGVCSNPFTLLLGARFTAGFVRPGDPAGKLDAALPMPRGLHEVRKLLSLPKFLGAPTRGEEIEFPLWPEDRAKADDLLAELTPPWFGLHPGARDRTKRWDPNRFAAVARELRRRHGGSVLFLGGPAERRLGEVLAARIGPPCRNLAGPVSLGAMGAVIDRLDLLVTNDSGPAHFAYALGTPTVVVFGSTDPAVWGPLQTERHRVLAHPVSCRPCDYLEDCPLGLPCLEGVKVSQVVTAAEELLCGSDVVGGRAVRS